MADALAKLLAETNPVPAGATPFGLDSAKLYEDTRHRIDAAGVSRRSQPSRPHVRRYVIMLAVCAALLVPALAFSGALGDLFGFSSSGSTLTISITQQSLKVLSRVGGDANTVRLLAKRDGEAFYGARSANGQLCVGTGDADAPALSLEQLQCSKGGDDAFPSPAVPILQTSPFYGEEGTDDVTMQRLTGFAADGVSRVELTGASGVVASAEVNDNVFAADVPHTPVTAIVAFDDSGNAIWSRPLTR